MQLYINTKPQDEPKLNTKPLRLSHLAYQIGSDGHLRRAAGCAKLHGGLLSLNGIDHPAIQDAPALAQEIIRECITHRCEGVCADFGQNPTQDRVRLLQLLSQLLQRNSMALFVSSAYGAYVDTATVLINTALSGGTLSAMLRDAQETFGASRIALDIERVTMDFTLPSYSGEGEPLTQEALLQLQEIHKSSVFFSRELCAKYFTYQKEGQSHFVLFDDADTLRYKIALGSRMHISYGFLLYSEIADLPDVFQ